jgi:DNA-binding transcriptional MerR regulator
MKTFSINTLQKLTGIRAHTLRIWEKRYNILISQRTSSNYRFFTVEDLRRLLNISQLIRNGYKISALAKMDADMMDRKIASLAGADVQRDHAVSVLIYCMFTRDIERFENTLEEQLNETDAGTLIDHVILPFLERVELFSYEDTSAEVHLVVTAIRKKLILGIEHTATAPGANAALLFLPKNEHYDLMLLYMTYTMKKAGIRTLYLGTNISPDTLKSIIADKQPSSIYTYWSPDSRTSISDYAAVITKTLPHVPFKIVLSTNAESVRVETGNCEVVHYSQLSLSAVDIS